MTGKRVSTSTPESSEAPRESVAEVLYGGLAAGGMAVRSLGERFRAIGELQGAMAAEEAREQDRFVEQISTKTSSPELAAPLHFTYRNWRGEVRVREATPCGAPYFGTTEWHPKPQWLLPMIDAEDGKRKDFAMDEMAMYGNIVGVPGVI